MIVGLSKRTSMDIFSSFNDNSVVSLLQAIMQPVIIASPIDVFARDVLTSHMLARDAFNRNLLPEDALARDLSVRQVDERVSEKTIKILAAPNSYCSWPDTIFEDQ